MTTVDPSLQVPQRLQTPPTPGEGSYISTHKPLVIGGGVVVAAIVAYFIIKSRSSSSSSTTTPTTTSGSSTSGTGSGQLSQNILQLDYSVENENAAINQLLQQSGSNVGNPGTIQPGAPMIPGPPATTTVSPPTTITGSGLTSNIPVASASQIATMTPSQAATAEALNTPGSAQYEQNLADIQSNLANIASQRAAGNYGTNAYAGNNGQPVPVAVSSYKGTGFVWDPVTHAFVTPNG